MVITFYIAAAIIMALGSLYFAWRNRDFRKFLAGALFVLSGILFYFYLANVSEPLLRTSFVETPQISVRADAAASSDGQSLLPHRTTRHRAMARTTSACAARLRTVAAL